MAKGGKRSGAGRPKGTKDGKPRGKRKQLPVAKKNPNPELPSKATYLQMEKYLSADNKKLYRNLVSKFESPSDCLKTIRDDLVARYNLGRIGEIEETSYTRKQAKEGIKEIEKDGKLNGKELIGVKKIEALLKLRKQEKTYPQLSSKVTSLASEIRQINELIDRIESGRPDKVINLFNILNGNINKVKTKALRDKVFDIGDNDVEEGEITEDGEQ